jgi:hypothetical protein
VAASGRGGDSKFMKVCRPELLETVKPAGEEAEGET